MTEPVTEHLHPARAPRQNALVPLLVSGMMTCVVSGIATVRAVGLVDDFWAQWLSSWVVSWVVAFPMLLVLQPIVRRFVDRFVP